MWCPTVRIKTCLNHGVILEESGYSSCIFVDHHADETIIGYHRSGFNCEYLLIVNCEFLYVSQLIDSLT